MDNETAMVVKVEDAAVTRELLVSAGYSINEEETGPWVIFRLSGSVADKEPRNHLHWAGFGCLKADKTGRYSISDL